MINAGRILRPYFYFIVRSLPVVVMLGGCGGGSTVSRYYLIDPVEYSESVPERDNGLAIEIMEVQVPQYLERFYIATRREANQLHFSETNQWGENLRKNLLRTLARNLSTLLGSNDVSTPLNRSVNPPDYRVHVHIEQFERGSDGIVSLAARWQVSGRDGGTSPVTLRTDLHSDSRVAENDFDRIVAEMQQLFGQLSRQIAESIRSSGNDRDGTG